AICEQVLAECRVLLRDACDLARAEIGASQRRRDDWMRLRRPRVLALQEPVLRDGPFLDRIDRLACRAIEEEQQALLRGLSDGGNDAAVATNFDEHRRCIQVVVPYIVMNDLIVPLQ